jgi:hypothetical protein
MAQVRAQAALQPCADDRSDIPSTTEIYRNMDCFKSVNAKSAKSSQTITGIGETAFADAIRP